MKTTTSQLLSSAMRAATLGLRFGLMFYLARSLPLAAVGLFGLYWAGLQLASSLITLDVYAHTARLFLKPGAESREITALHMGFVLMAIVILSPVAAIGFYASSSAITAPLLLLFVLHLPLEVITTDVGRLLLPLKQPLFSNIILFVRSALWVVPLVAVIEFDLFPVDVTTVVWFWLGGSVLALLMSFVAVQRALGMIVKPQLNLNWAKGALFGSGTFLAATLLFRSILGADRFVVERILGIEAVGVYALFASVCLGVLGLIESGVSAWHYPELVKCIQSRDGVSARKTLSLFVHQNTIAAIGLMILIAVGFTLATKILLAPVYYQNIEAFFAVVVGVLVYCVSMPFHYVVYGFHRDRILVGIYGVALAILVLWAIFFMKYFGILGAGLMLAIALTAIAMGRFVAGMLLMRTLPESN